MVRDEGILVQIANDKMLLERDLLKLAKEAIDAANLIERKYKFGSGCDKIQVYNDGHNEEYVTSDMVWHAKYLDTTYTQECSADSIYELYRDHYLYEHEYFKDEHYLNQTRIASNFREFVKHTRLIK